MQKIAGPKRFARWVGMGVLAGSLALSMGALASTSTATEPIALGPTAAESAPSTALAPESEPALLAEAVTPPPLGSAYPVTLETDFSRPKKALSKKASNHDFSLLNDLERLIRGSYKTPAGVMRPEKERTSNVVYISISQMPESHRVGRELIKAARAGVKVRVIHGKATQSAASRSLQKSINASKYKGKRTGYFKICSKGKSLACLSSRSGAIMHSKILYVGSTFTQSNRPAKGAFWSGSANLGGRSAEQTYNNGMTVYNDPKLSNQIRALWADMWAKRNVNSNYLGYVKKYKTRYGLANASSKGYTGDSYAKYGMFYSNLANVTIYPTPIYATPSNGKDPVLMMLDRIIPDDTCRIYVQHNRFKYRRIAVAQKLVELANAGCKVSAIAYKDDLASNRAAHCQLWIRICKPILDTFRTADVRIDAAWARPHDKTMLVSARMGPNRLNPEERQVNGQAFPATGVPVKLVQAGSAALTGSNLIVSDEITTETTDPQVFEDYLEHWHAIWKSPEHADYAY